VRRDNSKQKQQRIKPVVAILVVLVIIVILVGTYFIISHVRQQRAERENHRANAVAKIENGLYNTAVTTETIVTFYSLVGQAETIAETSDFETAILIYEKAKQIAAAINYTQAIELAEAGIEEMNERIIAAKREEAMNLFYVGNQLYEDGQYTDALEYLYKALELYVELDDRQNIIMTEARINVSEQKLEETEATGQAPPTTGADLQEEPIEISSNYEHNLGIDFDLRTFIDNQNQRPANQVRMGMRDGLNEGWYNGCGWVAAYNALIITGSPQHPADIVRHFEESGGIAFGGVFGTYPNAIEDYLRSFGYTVSHTLFPQASSNLDEVIKNSQVSILAYLHTNAAHYTTIEYREDIDKFIVYNDSFARARSSNLGFQSYTDIGSAIDSVAAFINSTREILFSFSLIVIS